MMLTDEWRVESVVNPKGGYVLFGVPLLNLQRLHYAVAGTVHPRSLARGFSAADEKKPYIFIFI